MLSKPCEEVIAERKGDQISNPSDIVAENGRVADAINQGPN
jgi:hypothetical protein